MISFLRGIVIGFNFLIIFVTLEVSVSIFWAMLQGSEPIRELIHKHTVSLPISLIFLWLVINTWVIILSIIKERILVEETRAKCLNASNEEASRRKSLLDEHNDRIQKEYRRRLEVIMNKGKSNV